MRAGTGGGYHDQAVQGVHRQPLPGLPAPTAVWSTSTGGRLKITHLGVDGFKLLIVFPPRRLPPNGIERTTQHMAARGQDQLIEEGTTSVAELVERSERERQSASRQALPVAARRDRRLL